eukprot:m.122932 g.122932  ORF g.122932 m.122932 type:complete len:339 (+) comp23365_c0_seq3:1002-2018(+)
MFALWLLVVVGVCRAACPFHISRNQVLTTGNPDLPSPSPSSSWMGQIPAATNTSDPLVRLNLYMQQHYTAAGNASLPDVVILVEDDYLVVLRDRVRVSTHAFVPRLYHDLKMVAHLALAVSSMLVPHIVDPTSHPFPEQDLAQYHSMFVDEVNATITSERFSDPVVLKRQYDISDIIMKFIEQRIAAGSASFQDLQALAGEVVQLLLENVSDAAKATIDMLIQNLEHLRNHVLQPSEWNGLRFVNGASHMAVRGSLVAQVFARILSANPRHPSLQPNTPNERFINLDDMVMNESIALQLLGTHVTDYTISAAFFDSPYALHRDILANATTAYLNQIFR